ncbi:uncharacterized protein LOC105663321 isoform X1 [Megachile rotundata]|uniref:uncharacterized protein LOC105663321 isoform X1 n=1 Tax=Megachile rotundata TaxID=143995 RepID=UPI003FD33360
MQVKDPLIINERVFWLCDAWPLNNSYKKFVMYMCYFSIHLVLMNLDLYDVVGNLQLMVDNIVDNTIFTTTYLMLILLRFSKLIKNAVAIVKREIGEDDFRNMEEKELYLHYNMISYNFGKYTVRFICVLVVLWYSSPLVVLLNSGSGDANSSKHYQIPIRARTFLNYEDNLRNYILMYMYQIPLMPTGVFHLSTIILILNLVLHVCGKFSILSYRIRNIGKNDSEQPLQLKVKELVERHVELIAVANTINSALQFILALELLQTSIRLAVVLYTILMLRDDQVVEFLTYGLYVMLVTCMLYLYSYLGEQLQYESTRVNDAYYEVNWLKMSTHDQKLLLYCMGNGRITLSLTAGKFYVFSLFGFINYENLLRICFSVTCRDLISECYLQLEVSSGIRKDVVHSNSVNICICMYLEFMFYE